MMFFSKKLLLSLLICTGSLWAGAQYSSIATDVSILRSFSKNQKFWSFGQTVQGLYHVNAKTSAYASIGYYTAGKFINRFTATAKDATVAQKLPYNSRSSLRFRQISLGMRRYLKGAYDNEENWNLYALAGFGLLLAQADNNFQMVVDTVHYVFPKPMPGNGTIHRLTFDVGMGAEVLLGSSIYLYSDLRTWLQASDYPSPFLYNNNIPHVLLINTGIRILFN